MDFISVIIFLFLYYIRPQEWIWGVAALRPVTIIMVVAFLAMFWRERGVSLKEVFKTPHDRLMMGYFLWIVATATDRAGTFGSVYNLFAFYLVTVLALSNLERIRVYLACWATLIGVVALLALAGEYGFDPMGSYDLTHGSMHGRLSLNLSIFENPNVLGNSVMPLLLLLYFMLIWKRPIFMRIAALPLFLIPAYCVFLTQSKGAYLACFATIVAAMAFRRPKMVQFWMFIGAATVGWAAVSQLPRMSDLDAARRDPGIQGRLIAFDYGLEAMREGPAGIGYGNFLSRIDRARNYRVTPHSSFVNIGAQLGLPGLFLFCGLLYCCLRTLLLGRNLTDAEERVRRLLFVLLISFIFSSWMIDWAFRGYFFLIVAAIAAFHRHLVEQEAVRIEQSDSEESVSDAFAVQISPAISLAVAGSSPGNQEAQLHFEYLESVAPNEENPKVEAGEKNDRAPVWNRLRFLDLCLIAAFTWATVFFWRYVMTNI